MTSEPPRASFWATPPEFYLDENTVTRSVRRLLTGLGYSVHTPAELFGDRTASLGAADEEWLKRVTGRRWAIIGRDIKIYERPWELKAYRDARVQVFLLPGQALAVQLTHLVTVNLSQIGAITSSRKVGTWYLTESGPTEYDVATE
jgi:hypothetical protein